MKVKSACLAAVAAVASLAALPVPANDPAKPTQQGKFAACAHESKGLKGEEHQRFMSECLKENRMKSCNEEAGRKNLHGDERRSFMSSCLKG